jgi:two-component system, chemotaxis family, chemotaxis protein CheY
MKKILIVDDAKLMRNIIKNTLLEHERHEIIEAQNGEEAVSMYKDQRPDLVTMDITMEHRNGLDAAREILAYDRDARIIMVTAVGQEKMLMECVNAGVSDYIVKPFSKERIASSITKALAKAS